ncbi:MAG: MBL fold metallo-hydrolase, partial [Burkholderiaceae bacterium]
MGRHIARVAALPGARLHQLAWQWVQQGEAVLVDVRTDAAREWAGFVPG